MIKELIKRISVKYLETELKKLNDELDKKTEDTIKYREEISNFKNEKDILSDKLTCLLNNVSDKNEIVESIRAFEKVLNIIKNNNK